MYSLKRLNLSDNLIEKVCLLSFRCEWFSFAPYNTIVVPCIRIGCLRMELEQEYHDVKRKCVKIRINPLFPWGTLLNIFCILIRFTAINYNTKTKGAWKCITTIRLTLNIEIKVYRNCYKICSYKSNQSCAARSTHSVSSLNKTSRRAIAQGESICTQMQRELANVPRH